jgi:hypothetical protein
MTTPRQELTLPGGWAKALIPLPIASGVNAPWDHSGLRRKEGPSTQALPI